MPVHLQRARAFDEIRQPVLRRAHEHDHRRRHATLPRRAEARAGQRVERLLLVRVREHDGVVLRAHHRLDALAVLAREVVDVRADRRRADERHRLDIRMRAERIDHLFAAMHDVEHARRHARFHRQFDQLHRRERVLFGRLQHEGVAADDRHREHPERDHRGEIEGRDAGADANRLAQRVRVDAARDVLREFAHLQRADAARVFHHFEAAEDIAFRVRERLALLGRQRLRDALHVLANQVLKAEHEPHARAERRRAPRLERVLRGGDGGVHLVRRRERHAADDFLRRRIDDVPPFARFRFDELAVDQQFGGTHGRAGAHTLRRMFSNDIHG